MPVHYGSHALNYHTISSPLGTQLPQAVRTISIDIVWAQNLKRDLIRIILSFY